MNSPRSPSSSGFRAVAKSEDLLADPTIKRKASRLNKA